jgi:hypothetical protein
VIAFVLRDLPAKTAILVGEIVASSASGVRQSGPE